jgi:hypothetical protein
MIDHPTRIEIDGPPLLAPTKVAVDAADDARTIIIRILRERAFRAGTGRRLDAGSPA